MNKLVIGNLKMNIVSKIERNNYFKSFRNSLRGKKLEKSSIVLCVPAIHLEAFVKNIKNKNVSFGTQNGHWENTGAFTGEMSPAMAKNLGAEFEIVGHSERRKYCNETNEMINAKIINVLKNNLTPIVCIGESLLEKEAGETKKVILKQLTEGLANVSKTKLSKMIIAYEPIWSISTSGVSELPTAEEIMSARILIQKTLIDKFKIGIRQLPRIIYGGSVDYKNVKEVCIDSGVDGVLVGSESLHPASFVRIAEVLEKSV